MILAGAAGVWLGPYIITPIMFAEFGLSFDCGDGACPKEYPKEVFAKINDEIPQKVDDLLGQFSHYDYMVVVVPELSGYKVHMAGRFRSSFWDKEIQKSLHDWITSRMDALDQEYRKLHAEKPNKALEAITPLGVAQHQH